jgi:hypothetical protein
VAKTLGSRQARPATRRLAGARKAAEAAVEADTYQVAIEPGITAPRATGRDIRRHKASSYDRHPVMPEGA